MMILSAFACGSASSSRTASASRLRIVGIGVRRRLAPGSTSGAPGLSTAIRAIRKASWRPNGAPGWLWNRRTYRSSIDLVEQLADVLHELDVELEVADRAELGEHLLAEPVRGRDRRRVELRDRSREPRAAGDTTPSALVHE